MYFEGFVIKLWLLVGGGFERLKLFGDFCKCCVEVVFFFFIFFCCVRVGF